MGVEIRTISRARLRAGPFQNHSAAFRLIRRGEGLARVAVKMSVDRLKYARTRHGNVKIEQESG